MLHTSKYQWAYQGHVVMQQETLLLPKSIKDDSDTQRTKYAMLHRTASEQLVTPLSSSQISPMLTFKYQQCASFCQPPHTGPSLCKKCTFEITLGFLEHLSCTFVWLSVPWKCLLCSLACCSIFACSQKPQRDEPSFHNMQICLVQTPLKLKAEDSPRSRRYSSLEMASLGFAKKGAFFFSLFFQLYQSQQMSRIDSAVHDNQSAHFWVKLRFKCPSTT